MSGSGGGGGDDWRPNDGPGQGEGVGICAVTERTVLNSPNAAVIATLGIGSMLDVRLETAPTRLVAQAPSGAIAGAITTTRLVTFIRCIGEGNVYVAEVLSISGGRVDVEIRLA